MGEANFYYFTCLKLLSHLDLPLSVTLGEMAPLFVIAAFLTLTLPQSASGSNGTETTVNTNEADVTAESASVGELRLGSGVVRPGPVMRERAPPICRTRYLYHPEKADWEGAKMLCEMEGGQLAVITSEAESPADLEDCRNFGLAAPTLRGRDNSAGSMARVLDLLAGTGLSPRGNTRTTNIASLSITGAKTPNGATAIVTILGLFSAKLWSANPRVVVSHLDIRAPSKDL